MVTFPFPREERTNLLKGHDKVQWNESKNVRKGRSRQKYNKQKASTKPEDNCEPQKPRKKKQQEIKIYTSVVYLSVYSLHYMFNLTVDFSFVTKKMTNLPNTAEQS